MDPLIKKEIVRLKHLKGNTKKTKDELIYDARINIKVREFGHIPLFSDKEEQDLAKAKFKAYLKNNEIESPGEIDMVRSLVYNEVFEIRIQKQLNQVAEKGQFPPEKNTKQLTDIQNQKLLLKSKLGIDQAKVDQDDLTGLEILKKRFKNYINAHRNEFTITDSSGKLLLLRKRVKDFDSMEHPWFAGRWLFNYEILKDVKNKKLSPEDAWRYLCCASQGGDYKPAFDKEYCTDYIKYCLNHWSEITKFLK